MDVFLCSNAGNCPQAWKQQQPAMKSPNYKNVEEVELEVPNEV
jgi:hypothetical protein